jgi:hypothetical protein
MVVSSGHGRLDAVALDISFPEAEPRFDALAESGVSDPSRHDKATKSLPGVQIVTMRGCGKRFGENDEARQVEMLFQAFRVSLYIR